MQACGGGEKDSSAEENKKNKKTIIINLMSQQPSIFYRDGSAEKEFIRNLYETF